MKRSLPPLNALRTFEAAARLGSFSEAAQELYVTHGAVSRAVRELEDWLGIPLFHRKGRRVALTELGRGYLLEISAAFDRIALATARLLEQREARLLYVDALPTFTMRWLIPRLPRFQIQNPGVELRLTTSDRPITGASEGFDVAIRRGPEPWPSLRAERFLDERSTPVCTPALLREGAIREPKDLLRATLLEADTRPDAWRDWLRAHGPARAAPAHRLRFDHFYLTLQAAQDGLGVAMGPLPIIDDDLVTGRLVAPFPDHVVAARSYFSLVPEARQADPAVAAFVAWLQHEGRAEPRPPPGPRPARPGRQTGRSGA